MPFKCPNLPYAYDALEPVIDTETMQLHHSKHHQGYVDKLNKATAASVWEGVVIDDLLRRLDEVQESTREAVRNNGGGHFNHSLFWRCMAPCKQVGTEPRGALAEAIDDAFGSFDRMKEHFTEAAMSRFGSGWTWLCVQPDRRLHVATTANQDTTLMPASCGGLGADHTPILGLDVWEHAYYLKHRNDRAAYVDGWWRVVHWDAVAENFARTRRRAEAAA